MHKERGRCRMHTARSEFGVTDDRTERTRPSFQKDVTVMLLSKEHRRQQWVSMQR
jgi:hypothetical protein